MSTIMFRHRWRLTLAGILAALLLALGGSLASRSDARSRSQSVKPTIVLVHGAWADVTINSSHASLVSHPAAVTKLVLAAAHAAG